MILEVNRIPNEKRRKEEDIKTEFRELLPDLLGWILDMLAKALKYKSEHPEKTRLREYPRMADFAEYGEVIARCIGYGENEFIQTYFDNIEIQNDEVMESSIVANVLMDFMEDRGEWEGSATLLHTTLTNFVENKEGGSFRKNKLWPSAPNSLTRKINELAPTLKEKGIDIIHKYENKRKCRLIKIINLQKIPLLSSYRSSGSSSSSNSSSNEGDDIIDADDKNNTLHKFCMPPANDEGKGNKEYRHDEQKIHQYQLLMAIFLFKQTTTLKLKTWQKSPSYDTRRNI